MKIKLAIAFSVLLGGCVPYHFVSIPTSKNQSNRKIIPSVASIITVEALHSFKTKYKDAPIHKAFAQSDTGVWAWDANLLKRDMAINNALVKCQSNNKKYEENYPCEVINVNDEWIPHRFSK